MGLGRDPNEDDTIVEMIRPRDNTSATNVSCLFTDFGRARALRNCGFEPSEASHLCGLWLILAFDAYLRLCRALDIHQIYYAVQTLRI